MNLEVESADAGVSQHDVAVRVSTDDQRFVSALPACDLRTRAVLGRRRPRGLRRLVDDEDVLEDGAVLDDGEHRDAGLAVLLVDPRAFSMNGGHLRRWPSSADSAGREEGGRRIAKMEMDDGGGVGSGNIVAEF